MNDAAAVSQLQTDPDDVLFFNGVNITTGDYAIPPMLPEDVSAIARGQRVDPQESAILKAKIKSATESHYGVRDGVDPKKLEDAGWGVIFAPNTDPAIRDGLKELLSHRREQATRQKECRYKEYIGDYCPGESASAFLRRHGGGYGTVDPDEVPYYLLIVGDPEAIPFSFQYQLDVQHGVGRVHFKTPEEYANYARSVVAAENNASPLPPRIAFFGVANPDDHSTNDSCQNLTMPLAEDMRNRQPNWRVESFFAEDARKARLSQLFWGAGAPALLFTSSHGGEFLKTDPRQVEQQGCLICQDWPGPVQGKGKELPQDYYFAADDIPDDARVPAMITFHFACFGAGTPRLNEYPLQKDSKEAELAPHAFVAGLPRRLLGHPKGGALASISHVERAWTSSFRWPHGGPQVADFQSTLARLANGFPVGWATEFLSVRYAAVSSDLTSYLRELNFDLRPDDKKLARMWLTNNDARGYVVIGDPAVRLCTTGIPV